MKGQIKKALTILFAVLFVATMTASAVNAEEELRCGNEPHLHIHKLPPLPDPDPRIDRINEQRIDSIRVDSVRIDSVNNGVQTKKVQGIA
jgi:hypothetical protein